MSLSPEHVLLIEDEDSLGQGLVFNLELEGFKVTWHRDGGEGLAWLRDTHADLSLVILDLMLPSVDGFSILAEARRLAPRLPVLVLSALGRETDKVRALQGGADDYVTKPFSLLELLLRIKGLVRRLQWYREPQEQANLRVGHALLDQKTLILALDDGRTFRLSPTEALLARTFVNNRNRILSRTELLREVWNLEGNIQTRTVDVFVSKLRRYIEADSNQPEHLLSIRGVGYVYVTDDALREELRSREGESD